MKKLLSLKKCFMGQLCVDNHVFDLFLNESQIEDIVQIIAKKMTADLSERLPVFMPILNGSFMFAADLLKNLSFPAEVSFIKYSSYEGSQSSGSVKSLIGIENSLKGRTVVIIEDIVETGTSLEFILQQLKEKGADEVQICTLLFKPERFQKTFPIDYIGKMISNEFVIGYGMDYNELGRNTRKIYKLK